MPWSNALPSLLEVSVQRASLPSTVSRKHMSHAATTPATNQPCQNRIVARMTKPKLTQVTTLGVILRRAHQRVAASAGTGQTYLVTRSVTPLYELSNNARSIAAGSALSSASSSGLARLLSAFE